MDPQPNTIQADDEISLRDLVLRMQQIFRYLLSRWIILFAAGIMGGGLGYFYATLQPTLYVSRLSFVVEDGKSGGGGIAALAGQFGFDMGGGSGGSLFSGDNILVFLKSESLVRETLLTPYDSSGKTSLADRYADISNMRKKWTSTPGLGDFRFIDYADKKLPRAQDSILQNITRSIIKTQLEVARPDKKAGFIEVKFKTRDELLSQLFAERLVATASQRYINSKTSVKQQNVQMLERKADSLSSILNSRTYSAAASQQVLVDANPGLRSAAVGAEITSRDKTIAATLYAEVVKNLEMARTILSQATPAIQMVDQSSLPLTKERTGRLKSLITGGFLLGFLTIVFLLMRRWWKQQMANLNSAS